MGFAGVAMASDGAGSFLLNPARLSSVEPGVSVSLLARRFELDSGSFDEDTYYDAYSLTAGFPLPETKWRAGLGLGRSLLLLEQRRTDLFGEDLGSLSITYSALVLGGSLAYEGPVELTIGVSARRVSEPFLFLTDSDAGYDIEDEAGWGVDLGAQARYTFLKPRLDGGLTGSVGIGYAIQNWGSDLSIPTNSFLEGEDLPTEIPFPLATRARLGWTGSLGYDTFRAARRLQIIGVDIALEASHSLTRQETPGVGDLFPTYRTAAPLGRIRPLDALLGRDRASGVEQRGDVGFIRAPPVTGHRAIRLHALETLTMRYGLHRDDGFGFGEDRTVHAFGVGLSAAGLFRLVDADGRFGALADRGDLHLSYAHYGLYDNEEPDTSDQAQPWVLGLTLVARWP